MALTLLAGLFVYFRMDKEVTLTVDGRAATMSTLAGSVGDLLEARDVPIGEHDRIRPSLDAAVTDGLLVRVDHAKEIQLVLNGGPRTVYVIGQTVDDVLQQINLRAGRNAFLQPSRGAKIQDGDVIEFRRAVSIKLRVGGKTTDLITNAPDVGYLLDSLGVIVRRNDLVSPPLTSSVAEGALVKVVRVRYEQVTKDQTLAYDTRVRYSNQMAKGTRRIQRAGQTGLERVKYRVRKEDGKVVARQVLSKKKVRAPSTQVVVVGTRRPNIQTGTSSWYYREGMVAAHKTLPKGTHVRVTNLANGRTVTVVIDDRGPFVNGWILDLSDDAFAKLAPLGTGTIKVRLEW